MVQLIIVILAISLAAVLVSGGTGYLSGHTGTRIQIETSARSGFASLDTLYTSYRMANGFPPTIPSDEDDRTWIDELSDYGSMPKSPKDMEWGYYGDGGDRWFCLNSPSTDAIQWSSLRRVPKHFAEGVVEIRGSCTPPASGPDISYDPDTNIPMQTPITLRYILK